MKRWLMACMLGIVVWAVPAWGWGPEGHRIVATIAERYMSGAARKAAQELLDGQSLADASTWADDIRKEDAYRHTGPWHYINVPPGTEAITEAEHCPESGCVLSAIRHARETLADKNAPRASRAEALRFLIHFVGDIHQPMHVSHAADRGGNDIPVTLRGEKTNLHRLWDSGLLHVIDTPWPQLARWLADDITAAQIVAWSSLEPEVWATETYRQTVAVAYVVPEGGVIDGPYVSASLPIVREQLSKAGIRLALLLDDLLGPDPAAAEAERLTAQAELLVRAGRPEDARVLLTDIVRRHTGTATAHFLLQMLAASASEGHPRAWLQPRWSDKELEARQQLDSDEARRAWLRKHWH